MLRKVLMFAITSGLAAKLLKKFVAQRRTNARAGSPRPMPRRVV
jgi:hypothetical protein